MSALRHDPVAFTAITGLAAGAFCGLVAAAGRGRRRFAWLAMALGLVGLAIVGFEIWFGITQAE